MVHTACPQELHRNSLHFKTKSLHTSRQFTPHHFTYSHSILTSIPLLVTTFLTLFLNVFSLQRKETSKPAGKVLLSSLLDLRNKLHAPAILPLESRMGGPRFRSDEIPLASTENRTIFARSQVTITSELPRSEMQLRLYRC
jgi:hypothetical protein